MVLGYTSGLLGLSHPLWCITVESTHKSILLHLSLLGSTSYLGSLHITLYSPSKIWLHQKPGFLKSTGHYTEGICYIVLVIAIMESKILASLGFINMMVVGFLDLSGIPMSEYLLLGDTSDSFQRQ